MNVDSDEEIVVKSTKKKIVVKSTKDKVKKDGKSEIDYSYLRLPDNEILVELEKEDNKIKSK